MRNGDYHGAIVEADLALRIACASSPPPPPFFYGWLRTVRFQRPLSRGMKNADIIGSVLLFCTTRRRPARRAREEGHLCTNVGKYQNGTSYTRVSARHKRTRLVLFGTPSERCTRVPVVTQGSRGRSTC